MFDVALRLRKGLRRRNTARRQLKEVDTEERSGRGDLGHQIGQTLDDFLRGTLQLQNRFLLSSKYLRNETLLKSNQLKHGG